MDNKIVDQAVRALTLGEDESRSDEERLHLIIRRIFDAGSDNSIEVAFYGAPNPMNTSMDRTVLRDNIQLFDEILTPKFLTEMIVPATVDAATRNSAANRSCTGNSRGATMRRVHALGLFVLRVMAMLDPGHLMPTGRIVRQAIAVFMNMLQSDGVGYVTREKVQAIAQQFGEYTEERPSYMQTQVVVGHSGEMTPWVFCYEPEATAIAAMQGIEALTPLTEREVLLARHYRQQPWEQRRITANMDQPTGACTEAQRRQRQELVRPFCAFAVYKDIHKTDGPSVVAPANPVSTGGAADEDTPATNAPQRRYQLENVIKSVESYMGYLDASGAPLPLNAPADLDNMAKLKLPRLRIEKEIMAAFGVAECNVRRKETLPLNVALQMLETGNLMATAMIMRVLVTITYRAIANANPDVDPTDGTPIGPLHMTSSENYSDVVEGLFHKHVLPPIDDILDGIDFNLADCVSLPV